MSLVQRLIEKEKIAVNCRIKEGETEKLPLELAVQYSQTGIIRFLLKHTTETTYDTFSALETALVAKSKDSIEILLKHGCLYKEIDSVLKKSDFQTEEYGDLLRFIKAKLEQRHLFLTACREGNITDVSNLVSEGIYIDADDVNGQSALYLAVAWGQVEIVQLLLANNAIVDTSSNPGTPIVAALGGYKQNDNVFTILSLLLSKGLQVELVAGDKKDPFFILAKMATTLLYKSMRYLWESPECVKLRAHIQHFATLNGWKFPDTISDCRGWVQSLDDHYGSYLSSDSDSEEEEIFIELNGKANVKKLNESEICKKMVTWEKDTYLTEEDNDLPITVRLNVIYKEKSKIARTLLRDPALFAFGNVFTSNKNHFKKNGRLFVSGTTKKDKISPIYNGNKINQESPLLYRGKISPVPRSPEPPKYYIADYRGYAYITTLWNQNARRTHRNRNELHQPLYSMACLFNASNTGNFSELYAYEKKISLAELEKFNARKQIFADYLLSQIHALNEPSKARLELNKETLGADTDKKNMHCFNEFTYDNLGELLQSVYTSNYDLYFKLLECDFFKNKLLSGDSPFVSTAETPYHALRYAYGLKTFSNHQDEALHPRWRKDGKAERPYSGKVYIILHPIADVSEAYRLISMQFQGKCSIPIEIATEREISYYSYVKVDRIVYQHIAKYPSFKGAYKQIYLYKYGLDSHLYTQFQRYLTNCIQNRQLNLFKNLLGEYLCAYHEMRFTKIAEQQAKKRGGVLIYLDEFANPKIDGRPAQYTTPCTKFGNTQSPQKKHKEEVTKPTLLKRKNDKSSLQFFITNEIFNVKENRINVLAKFVYDFEQSKDKERSKSERKIRTEIEEIEKNYASFLHYVIIKGDISLAEYIITEISEGSQDNKLWGMDYFNVRDKYGNTVLHLSELIGNAKLIELLKAKGANSQVPNNQGIIPCKMRGTCGAHLQKSKSLEIGPDITTKNAISWLGDAEVNLMAINDRQATVHKLLTAIGKENNDSRQLGEILITRGEVSDAISDENNYYTGDFINLLLYPFIQRKSLIKVYPAAITEEIDDYYQQVHSQDEDYAFMPLNVNYDGTSQHKNHWTALIIDKKHQLIFYLDPAQKNIIPAEVEALKVKLGWQNTIILNPIDFQQKEKQEGFVRHCGVYVVEIFNTFGKCIQDGKCISGSNLPNSSIDKASFSLQTILSDIRCGEVEIASEIRRNHMRIACGILGVDLQESSDKSQSIIPYLPVLSQPPKSISSSTKSSVRQAEETAEVSSSEIAVEQNLVAGNVGSIMPIRKVDFG